MTDVISGQDSPVDLDTAPSPQPLLSEASNDELVRLLAERARAQGLKLAGEGGLLAHLTKRVVESALEGELDDQLGYDKHDPAGRSSGNSRKRQPGQNGGDRGRPGGHRGAAGSGRLV